MSSLGGGGEGPESKEVTAGQKKSERKGGRWQESNEERGANNVKQSASWEMGGFLGKFWGNVLRNTPPLARGKKGEKASAQWLTERLSPSLGWVTVRRAVNYGDRWIKTRRTGAAVCTFPYHTVLPGEGGSQGRGGETDDTEARKMEKNKLRRDWKGIQRGEETQGKEEGRLKGAKKDWWIWGD